MYAGNNIEPAARQAVDTVYVLLFPIRLPWPAASTIAVQYFFSIKRFPLFLFTCVAHVLPILDLEPRLSPSHVLFRQDTHSMPLLQS